MTTPCPTHGTDAQFVMHRHLRHSCDGCKSYMASRISTPRPTKTARSRFAAPRCICHTASSSISVTCPVHGRSGYGFGTPS